MYALALKAERMLPSVLIAVTEGGKSVSEIFECQD